MGGPTLLALCAPLCRETSGGTRSYVGELRPHLPRAERTCCSKRAAAALGSGLAKMAETTATPDAPALQQP
eukprot:768366-Hanusia_phi.AAC.2